MKYSEELSKCNTAKVILMLMIVLGHCCTPFASKTWLPMAAMPLIDSLLIVSDFLNSFHIYAFVLISGYIFRYQKVECGRYAEYGSFVRKKLLRLVVPYVFVASLWAIPIRLFLFRPSMDEVIRKFIWADSPEQLWFLLMLFWVFAIYYCLAPITEKNSFWIWVLAIVLYGVGAIWDYTLDYFQFFKALRFVIFFHIGYVLRMNSNLLKKLKDLPTLLFIGISVALFVLDKTVVVTSSSSTIKKLSGLGLGLILNVVASVSFFICSQKCRTGTIQKWLVEHFGKNTMPIYLFHQQLVYLLVMLISQFTHNAIIVIPVVFVLAVVVSDGISILVQRWPLTRFMVGISK